MPFSFEKTFLDGVILVTPKIFLDERSFFFESYKKSDFFYIGIREEFLQDNHSKSIKGVLRGLHFQKELYAQGKLVRCVYGEIFDVAVDIRKDSPTFGKWYGTILSAENKKNVMDTQRVCSWISDIIRNSGNYLQSIGKRIQPFL
jgi:dTDP-4-dehydrorhamnose 3,5-epimerase